MRFCLFAAAVVLPLLLNPALAEAADAASVSPPDPENTLYLDLTYGRVVIRMRPDLAPNHVERIKQLVRDGLYDGLAFHRVVEHFVAQTGDPSGNGSGNTGRPLKAEFTRTPQVRGTVSMARGGGKNSADSEWFIVLEDSREALDGQYTVWGQVISGMEFVDMIHKGDPRKDGRVTADADRVVSLQVAADADRTARARPADLLKAPDAANVARNFSGTEFRCVAMARGLGINPQATVAQLWTHGYMAGRFKAQGNLTTDEGAAEESLDAALSEVCTTYPGALLAAAVTQKLGAEPRAMPASISAFPLNGYTCKSYAAARGGANKDQADFADLWAFAFVQGYKSLTQPDQLITFEGRGKILTAAASSCAKNPNLSFLDFTALLAAKVKIK